MTDGPFKSMTRDPRGLPKSLRDLPLAIGVPHTQVVDCERCGGWYYTGEWPWCKGNEEDHDR